MGLKEVWYERNCQVWATVVKSGPITASSSSASLCFHMQSAQEDKWARYISYYDIYNFKVTIYNVENG